MDTITVPLTEARLRQLRELAKRFGLAPEELAQAGIEDLLARPDENFRETLDKLLKRNAPLYRRLASL
jgi:hypothetical protein